MRVAAGFLVVSLVGAFVVGARAADATPAYALGAGHACDTCHIEPSGWRNPPTAERRCALHCTSCHVSPSGGGLRTSAGLYFSRQQLSTWGPRPGDAADPARYRPPGHPGEGRYRLGEGFSGWRAGDIPVRAIFDRYGDIEAEPLISLGADLRWLTIIPLDDGRAFASFPMQLDAHVGVRPVENAVVVASAGFLGRERDVFTRATADDYLTVRELYAMVDRLPFGVFVRGGRFPLAYGWRIPDHTAFTRTAIQFGRPQDRHVLAVEAGFHANRAFGQAAMFIEGNDWPGDLALPARGVAATLGWRDLGWQLAASFARTDRVSDDETDRWSTGISWGLDLHPLTYLGQVDLVVDDPADPLLDDVPLEPGFAALHQLNWTVARGVMLRGQYDWLDAHLNLKDNHRHRVTVGLQLDPLAHVQTELLYRQSFAAAAFTSHELLWLVHVHL